MNSLEISVLSQLITSFLIGIIMIFIIKRSKKKLQKDIYGSVILRVHKNVLYIGYVFDIIAIAFLSIGFSLGLDESEAVFVLVVSLCIFIFGSYLTMLYKNKKVIFSDTKVSTYSLVGKKIEIYWSEVNKVTVGSFSTNIILQSGVDKVKVNCNVIGGQQFIDMMKKNIRFEVYYKALNKLDAIRGGKTI